MNEYVYLVRSNTFNDRAFRNRDEAIKFILEQMYELNIFGNDKESFAEGILDLITYGNTDEFEIYPVTLDDFSDYGDEISPFFENEDEESYVENGEYPVDATE